MRAAKMSGERLRTYLEKGIDWKFHKDIVLEYWKRYVAIAEGIPENAIKDIVHANELQPQHFDAFKRWFDTKKKESNFQMEDSNWLNFIDGTLNIFYKTKDPELLDGEQWFIYPTNAEEKAKEWVENQAIRGNPNINTFWKINEYAKPEETSGKRNGFIYSIKLNTADKNELGKYNFGVIYQAEGSVSLKYQNGTKEDTKCISWAGDCTNIMMVKIYPSGRMLIYPVVNTKELRTIPEGKVPTDALFGKQLVEYLKSRYQELFGNYESRKEEEKEEKASVNARKSAINTLSDEEVNITSSISNVKKFIEQGNVSDERRELNEQKRLDMEQMRRDAERASAKYRSNLKKLIANDMRYKMDSMRRQMGLGLK